LRRRRQVVHDVVAGLELAVDLLDFRAELAVRRGVLRVERHVMQPLHEPLHHVVVRRSPVRFFQVLDRLAPELIVGHRRARDADHTEVIADQVRLAQVVERRQELPLGQVARRAEDHHHAWRGLRTFPRRRSCGRIGVRLVAVVVRIHVMHR
jgi:hypothetical protein